MLLLNIDKNKPQTIFEQIVQQVINLVDRGELKEGYQMPPTRQLAEKAGINRSTVVRAYEELWAIGYLESSMGSYTRVRKRKNIVSQHETSQEKNTTNVFHRSPCTKNLLINKYSHLTTRANDSIIDFKRLEPDHRLIDLKAINSCYRAAISDQNSNIFGYSDPRGYKPLRNAVLNHMQLHSISAADDNILITNGSQNSLQLIFQEFVNKKDVVAVESPTYSMLIPLIKFLDIKVIEVPVSDDGMDVEFLEKVMKKQRISMIYTMPTFHNPTGITMSQAKREKLLQLCEQNSTIIVEDSFEEEMKYFGKAHLPIKSMDSKGIVIYLSSFSKVMSPGLRTGWIIAHKECIARLTSLKTVLDLSSNSLSQAILFHYCNSGSYELHIRKLMRVFRKRMKTALTSLKKHIPNDKASWVDPLGGFLIWLNIKTNNEINLEDHFLKYGVMVSNGNSFYFNPRSNNQIRISIAKNNENEIEEGIVRIGKGISEL